MKSESSFKNLTKEIEAFDVKAFVFKLFSYWKLFLISVGIALFIANYITKRKKKIYKIDTILTVKEEQNPLFSSNTNILFNWGGASDEVETMIAVLKSRSHNEKVVRKLHYYIDYLKDGKYDFVDNYDSKSYNVEVDQNFYQLINLPVKIESVNDNQVKLSIKFNDSEKLTYTKYSTAKNKILSNSQDSFEKIYAIDKWIESPYFKIKITKNNVNDHIDGFFKFNNFYQIVNKYRNISVKNSKKGTSLITLELLGTNKKKLIDYLNSTVATLNEDQRNQKIQYAVKVKNYIDTVFSQASKNLKGIEKNLGDFKQKNRIYDLSAEGQVILNSISGLDTRKNELEDRLEYYNNLNNYLKSNLDLSTITAPAIIAVEDPTISSSVTTLLNLNQLRDNLEQTATSDHPQIKRINLEIDNTKLLLFENLNSVKNAIQVKLNSINKQLNHSNSRLASLPKKEQGLIKFQRNYNITATNYEYLKQKQYEAGTAIAANTSNVKILDTAIDDGQLPIFPKPLINYLIALGLGLFLPLIYIIFKDIFNNKITTINEIEKTYSVPILGVITRNKMKNNLVSFLKPKSTIAESFRAIRSNLQFVIKDNTAKSKTIVLTSSVSGEGKTLCSMNIATVFALSNKKTILLGFDLRKPKLFDDFELDNNTGLTNYLIGQKTLDDVIINTMVPNLDLILSGPVPPNPSELILSKQTENLINILKKQYDYVIIDTPPIGLVADALELFKYSDATIYVIRQNYTLKGMPKMVDDKYKNGEVKNISFILNDFETKGSYGYGYGYGNYNNGYHQDDEKKSVFKRLFNLK